MSIFTNKKATKFVAFAGLLAIFLLAMPAFGQTAVTPQNLANPKQYAENSGCRYRELPEEGGELIEKWDSTPEGVACLVSTFTKTGEFTVTGGWVYNQPLYGNATEIPTEFVDGEQAAQIKPFTVQVGAGQSIVWEPTWNPPGTELGIRYSFTESEPTGEPTTEPTEEPSPTPSPEPDKWELVPGTGEKVFKWNTTEDSVAALEITFAKNGTVTMWGYVFTTPLTLNGENVDTHTAEGEAAPQITEFSAEVTEGEVWVFVPSWTNGTAELGIIYIYTEKSEDPGPDPDPEPEPNPDASNIFLAFVANSPGPVVKETSISEADTTNPITEKWSDVNRQVCFEVNLIGTGGAYVESGWFFGTDLHATLNGGTLEIPTFSSEGDNATQIESFGIPALVRSQTLILCWHGTESGTEIGLRMQYPIP